MRTGYCHFGIGGRSVPAFDVIGRPTSVPWPTRGHASPFGAVFFAAISLRVAIPSPIGWPAYLTIALPLMDGAESSSCRVPVEISGMDGNADVASTEAALCVVPPGGEMPRARLHHRRGGIARSPSSVRSAQRFFV